MSITIGGLTPQKLALLSGMGSYDIIFLQEVHILTPNDFELSEYNLFFNPLIYAGTLIYVKKNINIQDHSILIPGRVQRIIINNITYLNILHQRISNRKDMSVRVDYDIAFINMMDQLMSQTNKIIMSGDFGIIRRVQDFTKKREDTKTLPEWRPGMQVDTAYGQYEQQFMRFFIDRYDLFDIFTGKVSTYDTQRVRIDYFLIKNVDTNSYKIIKTDLTDHVMIIADI